MRTLVIAEKPSVGRDIAKVLGCRQNGDGYLYGGEYAVSWAIGHLAALFEPEDYDETLKRWRMDSLPIIPDTMCCKALPKTKKQLTLLKKLMNDKETVALICATDSGREGELIFRYIYQLAGCTKPFKRLWISSMTDAAIKDGLARLKDGHEYDALYVSARCRNEADWLVGMNATRAYTLQYGTLLSVGRVQTPTLAILTERQQEINAFVPKDYFEVKARFKAETGEYDGLWFDADKKDVIDSKLSDRGKAQTIAEKVKGGTGCVKSVEKQEKRQPPPLLFDLTELQRECNRKLGFSAQKTLSLAQALYERHKLITYPRTDSRYLSQDMTAKLPSAIKSLTIEPYREAAEYVLGLPKLPITKRLVDDSKVSDHHAIIPTGARMNTLTADERAVYDLIVRKFLAAFHPAYVYDVTTVITETAGELFISKGSMVRELGWMALYASETKKTKKKTSSGESERDDEHEPLPLLNKDDAVTVQDAQTLAKKTQPPKPYTEATLLSAMENAGRFVEDEALKEKLKESGLGTPATRAAIIERLIDVGYVTRSKKQLAPTEKGMKLIDILPPELRSPETTGKWERSLSLIAKGGMDDTRFMDSIKRYVRYIVASAAEGDAVVKQDWFPKEAPRKSAARKSKQKPVCNCPRCDSGQIFENTKAFYCSRWQEGCAFQLWKSDLEKKGKAADAETVRAVCAEQKDRP